MPKKKISKARKPAKKRKAAAKRETIKRKKISILPYARKAETFSLPPAAEKFEKPVRLQPPLDVPQPASVETIRKKKTPSRALAAVLAAGAMAAILMAVFIVFFSVDVVPALLIFLIMFVGFGILVYNFLETAG